LLRLPNPQRIDGLNQKTIGTDGCPTGGILAPEAWFIFFAQGPSSVEERRMMGLEHLNRHKSPIEESRNLSNFSGQP